jgi:hypothetical protein
VGVVRVVLAIPSLLLLIGIPGWLALRLLLASRLLRRLPRPESLDTLNPLECGYLAITLGACIVGPVALVLAMLGVFALWLLALVVALLCAGLAIVTWRSAAPLIAWHWEHSAWLCLGLLVIAAALFLRPGETLIGGEDTGIYYNSGVAMAKQGGIYLNDPVLADIDGDKATVRHLLINTDSARYRFQGDKRFTAFFTTDTSGQIIPQFLHLWPAWLAIFYALFGTLGPAFAAPVCGLLGVLGVMLLGRRLFGWPVGLLAGTFLTLNGIEVWFVRQSYTEAYQQFALIAALFGLLLLEERRDPRVMRLGAVVATLAIGNAALTHEETLFLLFLLVAYAVVLWLLRAWRPAHTWFFAVFGGMFALAVVQAGVFALGYTEGLWHHVYLNIWEQRLPLAAAALIGVALLVLVDRLRRHWWPLIVAAFDVRITLRSRADGAPLRTVDWRPDVRRWIRYAIAAGTAAYAIYGYILRPRILTGHAGSLSSYIGAPTPAGHNANLVRLGWYWSPLGILLIAIGATLLIARHLDRRTGPMLAFALVHTVVFVNETYTDDKYIYALRHYVPVVMPIFALFAAYAACNLPNPWILRLRQRAANAVRARPRPRFARFRMPVRRRSLVPVKLRSGGRFLGIAASCLLVVFFVATRAGTWTVRRYAGADMQLQQLADRFPANSVLLFSGGRDEPHLLATPLQFIYGRSAFVISTNYPRGDLIEQWLLRESATHPVYVLMGADGGKLFLPHTRLVPETQIGPSVTITLHDFESLQLQKPHNPQDNALTYTVYHLDPKTGSDPPLGTAPVTITAGQADERYDVQGFYGVEHEKDDPTPYRWTGPTALLRIPWTASLAQNGGTVTLRLAGGKRPAALGEPAHVTIALDPDVGEPGNALASFDVANGFMDYTVTIPPSALPAGDTGTAILRIESRKPWSPQDYAPPTAPIYDPRALGVQVQTVTVTPR